jgi:sec-independent protein translocase protein TatA
MLGLGAPEIGLIILAILLLFGYKKLPDASRSIGRSLRIFKGEMQGMKDDEVRGKNPATATPLIGQVIPPTASTAAAAPASGDLEAQLLEEASRAETRAAELRARAHQIRPVDAPIPEGLR